MRNLALCSLVIAVLMCACASGPQGTKPVPTQTTSPWSSEKDAIVLHLKADARLNLKNKKPHTLMLCVYQLKDPAVFNKLAHERSGLYELLECQVLDLSFAEATRVIAHPAKNVDMTIDRADGARYVAVVAGYYTVAQDKIVRLYTIPFEEKQPLFGGAKTIRPQKLDIVLTLGAFQLQDPTPSKP